MTPWSSLNLTLLDAQIFNELISNRLITPKLPPLQYLTNYLGKTRSRVSNQRRQVPPQSWISTSGVTENVGADLGESDAHLF